MDKKIFNQTLIGREIDICDTRAQVTLDSIFGSNWQLGTICDVDETFKFVKRIRISLVEESWSIIIKIGKVTSACKFNEDSWKEDVM